MRLATLVYMLALSLIPTACASHDASAPKEPYRLRLTVRASPTVNPDDERRPAPIVVRIYELHADGTFNTADYFSLQDKDATVLGNDLVRHDEFLLRPGEQRTIKRKTDPTTTAIGIVAAYRDLPHSVWRAVYPLSNAPDAAWYRVIAPKLDLTVELGPNAIKINAVN
ncbi:type VI secretion system lipoprotein TssJ [Burkholderia pyrrocinia]|uniref:type VI secretion system lipoprotein TssJ n=1 Tax=Burkholderia pyrrocinia TaxID=60550 RepID=UPI00158BFDD3|nr:type VI secretion system lipoprotein TssJ [Burkholderia pyrrocinia]